MQILLLEEDTASAELAISKFSKLQHTIQVATSLAAGEILFCSKRFDVILCAIKLPDGSGLDFWNFCRYAKVGRYRFPFFIFTINDQSADQNYSDYWEQLWLGATAIIPHSCFETKLWNILKSLSVSQMHQQFRMQPRLDVNGDITLKIENEPHSAMNAKVKNMSIRGMLIETKEPLWIGLSVIISGVLTDSSISLKASKWQVRWSQLNSDGQYLVGLYLQEVLDHEKIVWCEKINQLMLAV